MYVIGIDLGEAATVWARTTAANETDAQGAVPSAVHTAADGSLQVAGSGEGSVTDFITSLGSSEAVIVNGTPYGVEALVACVLAAAVEAGAAAVGAPPDAVALVHDDDLDAYTVSLLSEAARVAGIPSDRLLLVPRSAAGEAAAVGASQLAFASLPESPVESSGGVGDIAMVTGGLAIGVTAGAVGAGGVAGAVGGATVSGAELVGPGGSTIGPTGTSVGPAGAGGASGPAGSGAIAGTSWVPLAIAGAVAVLVAVVAVVAVVVAGGDDAPPDEVSVAITVDAAITVSTVAIAPLDSVIGSSVPETTAAAEPSTTLNPDIDLSAFVGDWELCQPSPTSPNVSAAVRYSFGPAGPNQLTIENWVYVFVDSSDCSTTGTTSGEPQTYTIDIVGEMVVDGIPAVQATAPGAAWLMGVDGDTLRYGSVSSADGFPTVFDPVSVFSRRL